MALPGSTMAKVSVVALIILAAVAGYCWGGRAADTQIQAFSIIAPGCYHTDVSEWHCPDTNRALSDSSDIMRADLLMTTRDGRQMKMALPERTDAVFLTRGAVENFLLRHYDATNDAKAADVRRMLERRRP